jgi:hypothetical protein
MHNAPSVTFPVERPRFAGLAAGGVWLAGAAATLLWILQADAAGWRQALAVAALALAGVWALWAWLATPVGELRWDGTSWTGPAGSSADMLEVALDLQRVLLVRMAPGGRAQWLWLERSRCPHAWMELRRAVYSRARPPGPRPVRPTGATP